MHNHGNQDHRSEGFGGIFLIVSVIKTFEYIVWKLTLFTNQCLRIHVTVHRTPIYSRHAHLDVVIFALRLKPFEVEV